MFFQKKLNKDDNMHEVNMTPLIDVSLVLVVMLMLATPLAFESSIAVRRTTKSAKAAEKESKSERVELIIMSEDSVRVNRTMVAREELSTFLEPLVHGSSHRLVVIKCDGEVTHGTFVDVLDQAKMSGAAKIAVTDG